MKRTFADGRFRNFAFLKFSFAFIVAFLCFDAQCRAHQYSTTGEDDCYRWTLTWDNCQLESRAQHPDERCRIAHTISGVQSECKSTACGAYFDPFSICFLRGFSYVTGGCYPDIPTGSVPEMPNGIDDDCDFYVDDEQCDGIDNDNDGIPDDDAGACLLKVLFVPMDWQGDQASFETAARAQFNAFIDDVGVGACPDNYTIQFLSVEDQFSAPQCVTDCGIASLEQEFRNRFPPSVEKGVDVIAFLTNHEVCLYMDPSSGKRKDVEGCRNGRFLWAETQDETTVVAHEIGHILGLRDQYCSVDAGSTHGNCNSGNPPISPPPGFITPPNFLGSDLECDPRADKGCCADCTAVNYGVCCEGNVNRLGGQSTMSYANAADPLAFDNRELDYLRNPPNPRVKSDGPGSVPMNCGFSHVGNTPLLEIDSTIDDQGGLSVDHASFSRRRPGLGEYALGTTGQYTMELRSLDGSLILRDAFDLYFGYDGPVFSGIDYSTIQYKKVARTLVAPISEDKAQSPIRITLFKDGIATSKACIVKDSQSSPISVSLKAVSGDLDADCDVDKNDELTPPAVICDSSDGIWHKTDVAIACTANDTGSGLADPQEASFSLTTNVGPNTETDNAQTGTRKVCDVAGNCTVAGPIGENKVDKRGPVITIKTPTDALFYTLDQVVPASYLCNDGGSGVKAYSGTVANGAAIDTSMVGPKIFTVSCVDNAGNSESKTAGYQVIYPFSGFFAPVDNLPILNVVKAGSAVPIKFSLSGDQGLNVLATGYPVSKEISCGSRPLSVDEQESVAAGLSGLSYDATTNQYVYVWGTDKAWKGTCRQFVLKLGDGTEHVADFTFK